MSTIDYSTYTLDELREAKSSINKEKFQENYRALQDELENRKPEVEARQVESHAVLKKHQKKELKKAKKRIKVLGVIQIIAALILAYIGANAIFSGQASILLALIVFGFVALNAICGYTLLTKQKKWYWLSLVNQGLQIPNLVMSKLVLSYNAIGSFLVGFSWPGPFFGFNFSLDPGFNFLYLDDKLTSGYVGFDIVAFIFFFAILTVLDERENEIDNEE